MSFIFLSVLVQIRVYLVQLNIRSDFKCYMCYFCVLTVEILGSSKQNQIRLHLASGNPQASKESEKQQEIM